VEVDDYVFVLRRLYPRKVSTEHTLLVYDGLTSFWIGGSRTGGSCYDWHFRAFSKIGRCLCLDSVMRWML
jgi:hypothetical protein